MSNPRDRRPTIELTDADIADLPKKGSPAFKILESIANNVMDVVHRTEKAEVEADRFRNELRSRLDRHEKMLEREIVALKDAFAAFKTDARGDLELMRKEINDLHEAVGELREASRRHDKRIADLES